MRNPTTTTTAIARLRRRVRTGIALTTTARLALVTAVLAVAAVGVARVFGVVFAPSPSWAIGLAVLALAGAWHARRRTPVDTALAAHVDRRASAAGLVMLATEQDIGPWRDTLRSRLDAFELPAVEIARPLARIGAATALVAGLVFVPLPPATRAAPRQIAIQAALEKAREEIRNSVEADGLRPEEAVALSKRASDLEERLVRGDPVVWADVDSLNEARRQQEAAQRGDAARMTASAASIAADLAAGQSLDAHELAEIARLAASLGLQPELSPELQSLLEALARHAESSRESGRTQSPLDLQALKDLGIDPKDLARLAEALRAMGGTRLRHAARDGDLAPPELDELRKLLEREGRLGGAPGTGELPSAQGGDGPFDPTPHEGESNGLPGRGGVSRGRGDAALDGTNDTELDTSTLRPERLTPGQPIPDKWEELRVLRAEPTPGARPIEPGGGTAGDGDGRATFHRDLAPRHRDAVQRFFTQEPQKRR